MRWIVTASPPAAEPHERPEELGPFSRSKVFLHRERLELLASGVLPPPVTVEVDLADGFCNHACPHCFFSSPDKHHPQFFPKARALSLGHELASLGVRAIEFPGGGEPTTNPEFTSIVRDFAQSGLPLGLVTNGQLVDRIAEVSALFSWIRVSLDAGTPDVYTRSHDVDRFRSLIDNITALASLRSAPVGVAFLVTPLNWESAPAAAEALSHSGISYLQFRPASKVLWNELPETALRAQELIRAVRASSPGLVIDTGDHKWDRIRTGRRFPTCETSPLVGIVKANGDVPFCCLRRDDASVVFGNVLVSDFREIWYRPLRRQAWQATAHSGCPIPCKHDTYNEALFALRNDQMHGSFL